MLEVKNLLVEYLQDGTSLKAVENLSFRLEEGKTLAILGQSGSGKSTVALSILNLLPASGKITSGEILFDGTDLLKLFANELRQVRGAKIAMLFQDPFTSLNPVFTIGEQICESLHLHQKLKPSEADHEALKLLELVQFVQPKRWLGSYPHELSGGMRQRAVLAMALAAKPKLLIADEPTTALDATIQLEILKLLKDLQARLGMAVLLITHNINVARFMSKNLLVMQNGRAVAYGDTNEIINRPSDPYTANLIECYRKLNPAVVSRA